MIIDMHTHFPSGRAGALGRAGPRAPNTIDAFVKVMDECKVDKFVVQASAPEADELKRAYEKYPQRLIPFLSVFPRYREEALLEIERNAKWIKGMGELMMARAQHNDPAWFPVMEACARHRFPALFHCSADHLPMVRDIEHTFHPRFIAETADRFPDVNIIIGHMGGYYWPDAIHFAKKYQNLFLETDNGADRLFYGMIEMGVKEVGSQKMCYGTDMPLFHPSWQISRIVDSDIGQEDKENILWKTAATILRIRE